METSTTTYFNIEEAGEYYPTLRSVFFSFMFCLTLILYVCDN